MREKFGSRRKGERVSKKCHSLGKVRELRDGEHVAIRKKEEQAGTPPKAGF